ncbi:MAG TPA: hypothetical protein V6C65_40740 [Allocoleopsis sp.]
MKKFLVIDLEWDGSILQTDDEDLMLTYLETGIYTAVNIQDNTEAIWNPERSIWDWKPIQELPEIRNKSEQIGEQNDQ